MNQNKKSGRGEILILVATILVFGFIPSLNSATDNWPAFNVCCERTISGAWCQNTLKDKCDVSSGLQQTPTSCDSTSFCKTGCCFDSSEGLCMENTPQRVCDDVQGTWVDDAECNIPQCTLGCCVLGTQASFVTLTRCKKMSGLYGLQTDFRTGVADEMSCISLAATQDVGACVFEADYQKTCRFTTRGECLKTTTGRNITSIPEFFKNYLCSAEELGTNCGPSENTMCVDGKQEVFFQDTCGNPANIYDATKVKDKSYWKLIADKSASCSFGNAKGNAGSKNCGNCDYFKGSICAKGQATYGNNICKDLNCYNTQNGNDYKNGESWCIYDGEIGEGKDKVGSRHYRHVCINGEETIEPCADYRNEQCFQDTLDVEGDKFIEAACRVNRWTDCIDQKEEEDCMNGDKRDCFWLTGARFTGLEKGSTASGSGTSGSTVFKGSTGNVIAPISGNAIFGGSDEEDELKEAKKETSGVQLGGNACLPNIPPGLKFWSDGDASPICSLGNSKCVVSYEKGLIASEKKCSDNCECLEPAYAQQMNRICTSLGDCGAYVNIANKFTDDGAEWKIKGDKQKIGPSIVQGLKK